MFRSPFVRKFGDIATSPQAEDAAVSGSPSEDISGNVANPVGRYYHDIVFRGRGHNALSLGDLRKLMQMCDSPELARYSLQAVHLFQRKGQDFSEEINSHFVRSVAVDGKQAIVAAKVLSKWKNRIGAWSTTTSLEKLLQAMMEQSPKESSYAEEGSDGDQEEVPDIPALTVELLEVSLRKGVYMSKPVFEIAIQLVPEESPVAAESQEEADSSDEEGSDDDDSDSSSDSSSDSEGDTSSSSDEEVEGGLAVTKKQEASLRDRLQAVAVGALGEEEASSLFA